MKNVNWDVFYAIRTSSKVVFLWEQLMVVESKDRDIAGGGGYHWLLHCNGDILEDVVELRFPYVDSGWVAQDTRRPLLCRLTGPAPGGAFGAPIHPSRSHVSFFNRCLGRGPV